MRFCTILFIAVLAFARIASAQKVSADTEASGIKWNQKISEELSRDAAALMKESHTQGVAFAIVHKGIVLKRSFFGVADVENSIPVSEKSAFWLASVAKHITTSLVLDLEEDGILSKEDLITKYVSGLPDNWSDIRIKHLMSHTAGIMDNSYNNPQGKHFAAVLNTYAPGGPDLQQFVALMKDVKKEQPAGSVYSYSDIGMMLLAIVASNAAGKPFDDLMKERIFQPAQMSSYFNIPLQQHANQVVGYSWKNSSLQLDSNKILVLATDQSKFGGAGSIFVTLDDMINWNKALNNNLIISQANKELLWTRYQLPSGKLSSRGYGLGYKEFPGGFAVGHNGAAGTEYWKFPEYDLDIIVLTNHGPAFASEGFLSLIADKLGLLDKIDETFFLTAMNVQPVSPDRTCEITGKYKMLVPDGSYYYIDFYKKADQPYALIQGLPVKLLPEADCNFRGYSKAIFFPGLLPPHFEIKDGNVTWNLGQQKLPLIKISD